jgi:uncharacterized protein (DUF4415 family)
MKNRIEKKIDRELAALAKMREEDIDTSDIPEIKDWSGAVIGKFYRPIKEQVCLRLDTDVLNWFRQQGPGYQTRINDLLRSAMTAGQAPSGATASAGGGASGRMCRAFRYPALEKRGELQNCGKIAGAIAERHCLFALTQAR